MSKASAAALGVGVVLFVILGAAVVYLFIRLNKMGSILEKVREQPKEAFKNLSAT